MNSVFLRLRLSTGVCASALLLCFLVTTGQLHAADELVSFSNPEHKVMYQELLREYRCLKCQNQNLADSDASLAGDLRREIRRLIEAGGNQADIEEYLVSRYGEFVLYRPRFNSKTMILWIGPFVLLVVGLFSLFVMVRGKSSATRHKNESSANDVATAVVLSPDLPDAEKLSRARDLLR